MPTVNDPTVIADLTARHDLYEQALAANDLAALNGFFWDSPHAIRYGVSEHLYGSEAIVAYRQNAGAPPFTDRRIIRREIVAFGPDVASVMCELSQLVGGQPRHSRQSQTWVRFPEVGWKIVAAHVSNALVAPASTAAAWDAYATQAANALGLPLAPAHRPGVVQNLQRTAAIAAPLLAFTLPGDELAPVFTP